MILHPDRHLALLSAINLNNEGVVHLAAKNSEMARLLLGRAMQVIQHNLWTEVDFEEGPGILKRSSFVGLKIPDMQDEVFYVFDEALMLSLGVAGVGGNEQMKLATKGMVYVVAASILFNLSLAIHQNSIQEVDAPYTAAKALYQICSHLLQGARGTALEVATRNNLAHVHWIMGDRKDAVQLMNQMMGPGALPHDHLDKILLNIMMAQLVDSATAKAA